MRIARFDQDAPSAPAPVAALDELAREAHAPVAELGEVGGAPGAAAPTARLDGSAPPRSDSPAVRSDGRVARFDGPAARSDGPAARSDGPVGGRRRDGPPQGQERGRAGGRGRGADRPDAGAAGHVPEPGAEIRGERAERERPQRRVGPEPVDPDADPVAAAKEICLRLLTDRACTREELAQALRRRTVSEQAIAQVLDRFDEVGLIDDAAFAGQWVRSRHRFRGLARRAIAQELRRKGVDDEVAAGALAEVDDESEEQRARELVERKVRTVATTTPEDRTKAARRLVGMLARKGYGAAVAYRVVREVMAAQGADLDSDPPDD